MKAEGGNRGANDTGYDKRRRHAAWGAERAVEADRMGECGQSQVDNVLCQERRWGAGVTNRCYGDDRYLWRAVGGGK